LAVDFGQTFFSASNRLTTLTASWSGLGGWRLFASLPGFNEFEQGVLIFVLELVGSKLAVFLSMMWVARSIIINRSSLS
jgi:hypothetical protein